MSRLIILSLTLSFALVAQAPPKIPMTPAESAIRADLDGMRKMDDRLRPAASPYRRGLAGALASLSTEGDFGRDTLESVAAMLSQVLRDAPIPLGAKGPADLPQVSGYHVASQVVRT